jgi:hypothetical protein
MKCGPYLHCDSHSGLGVCVCVCVFPVLTVSCKVRLSLMRQWI